jgi:hypothetical protein
MIAAVTTLFRHAQEGGEAAAKHFGQPGQKRTSILGPAQLDFASALHPAHQPAI